MDPVLIPVVKKIIDVVGDRIAGSKKAAATSTAGATTAFATLSFDPGTQLFPQNDGYALILNSLFYLISGALMIYRDKKAN